MRRPCEKQTTRKARSRKRQCTLARNVAGARHVISTISWCGGQLSLAGPIPAHMSCGSGGQTGRNMKRIFQNKEHSMKKKKRHGVLLHTAMALAWTPRREEDEEKDLLVLNDATESEYFSPGA